MARFRSDTRANRTLSTQIGNVLMVLLALVFATLVAVGALSFQSELTSIHDTAMYFLDRAFG